MTFLPNGWTLSKVGDLIELNPKNSCDGGATVGFVPMPLLGTRYLGSVAFEAKLWNDVKKGYTHFADGDVLLAKITPCFENGKAGIPMGLPSGLGAGSTEYFVCRAKPELLEPRYLLAWFKTDGFMRNGAVEMTGSVGHKRVPKEYVVGNIIPLAPIPEQKRIADKLDSALARVDTCRERLSSLPGTIERFRSSVLAAATSGVLTRDWRAARSTGSYLSEPDPSEDRLAVCLPPGWVWSSPEGVKADERHSLAIGPFGSDLTVKDYRDEGVPLVFVREIRARKFGDEKTKYVSFDKAAELAAHSVSAGDLLITKMGAPPGDAAIYPDDMPDAIITADCIKLRVNPSLALAKFVGYVVSSPLFKERLREITAGVAQQKVSLKRLRNFPLQLAPLEEQQEIVRRVEVLFRYADRLEARLKTASEAVERLTPALLAKAFRGELLPQDPNDEPAELSSNLVYGGFEAGD
ncbi:restriction endonuclease subunit S [Paraburkholderia domus]|uniref:restriction endonuclease subunit S n=1 Tax=Paraburkholderia domus TaxID=2793075 RepID=UPI001B294E4A|nr:restriction endonuclease subunit S [Paraburkholderia domus]CAE6838132.1 hypothetical protein R75483_07019 [Paraburkholderia domus]